MASHTAKILVEACVGSAADVARAVAAGAGRVELCGALELGGLTPSIGLAETLLEASTVPVIVMVRPRAGGFCYDRDEFAAMLRDAERLLALGAAGIAFGVLTREGCVDAARTRELAACSGERDAVFHRACDFARDWRQALEAMIAAGCTRVLSSGGAPSALAGMATLRGMIEAADKRIEVMPGGGVRADNIAEIVKGTGCRQVHLGSAGPAGDGTPAAQGIELCDPRSLEGMNFRAVNAAALRAAIAALREPPA
jgi:copper homeostasis protein